MSGTDLTRTIFLPFLPKVVLGAAGPQLFYWMNESDGHSWYLSAGRLNTFSQVYMFVTLSLLLGLATNMRDKQGILFSN